ncbi:hypothetical protein E2C01_090282 [Portunus trituberculatus]|uniref:Uncharacterized protein n=1 Tax=Portunus trituberculatus TaxID=210409 RepID=A0A5B7JLE8_PORTR|nr:hypothetical protein [Portunus trituberculatus]
MCPSIKEFKHSKPFSVSSPQKQHSAEPPEIAGILNPPLLDTPLLSIPRQPQPFMSTSNPSP